MRIIGGTHKGRNIIAPSNLPVRPTTDSAKESLFNILNNRIEFSETEVLDLFAGTGNITYEFASRGVKSLTAVDINFNCIQFVKKTVAGFQFKQVNVVKGDVFKFLKQGGKSYDLIFADPPYEMPNIADIHKLVFENAWLKPEAMLIIEHGPKTDLSTAEGFLEHRKYGNVNFSIFIKPKQRVSIK